jgi:hypothetical protein
MRSHTNLQCVGALDKTALAIRAACADTDVDPGGRRLFGCTGRTRLGGVIPERDVHFGPQITEEEDRTS